MRISYLCLMAIVAVILEGKWTSAAPSPQTEDVLKTLQQLDRLYSAVARPSVRSGPSASTSMSPKVQRAINMLRLQHLDKLYADRSRPRFGKRGREDVNFLGSDYDHQEYQRSDVVNRKPGGLSAQKYILDLDPMYR
ncbi:uncharacterized protein [Onthophagus taurus]|uniref:uncharacterized protein n=1 Tax=Onthophagus taurus TaxID=166361 RepID=UPI0039BE3568